MRKGGDMVRSGSRFICRLIFVVVLASVALMPPRVLGAEGKSDRLGGVYGSVKNSQGSPAEGMMVQLISAKNSIRTTVYTNELGEYEFPKLEAGDYTLRIARPLQY